MDKKLLTTQETALLLGLSDGRVRRMILDGIIPAEKFGRVHMIKRSDAEKVKVYGKTGRPKNCPKHDWIKLDRKGECSFCFSQLMDQAIEDSEFETCRKCKYRRKAYDPRLDEEDDPVCERCGAYDSFR